MDKCRKRDKLLHGSKLVKMRGRIYQSCVKSAMLYGSETCRMRKDGDFNDCESNDESNRCDGVVTRASASYSADLGFIS